MRTIISLLNCCLLALFSIAIPLHAANPVIVHEWGTFTSLQDGRGQAIGGINVDDEPVPDFVWQVAGVSVTNPHSRNEENIGLPPYTETGGKGWAVGDPTVTMRLETPVLYIYPPKGQTARSVPPLDVHVDFHGGILSQYYPYAQVEDVPLNGGIPFVKDKIIDSTMSGLTWKGVQIGASGKPVPTDDKYNLETYPSLRGEPVKTDDKVWTTPREVSAPLLEVKFSEPDNKGGSHDFIQAEHFLFYRGVGHLDSPLFLSPGSTNGKQGLAISSPMSGTGLGGKFDWAWMVQIRADGSCAYYCLDHPEPLPFVTVPVARFPDVPASFADSDFSIDSLNKLKVSMQAALIKESLYPDEASAMLRTWELSYFKSPGLRFFYIVPRAWVDKVLPLTITGAPTEITRVMMGRIELVTDAQRLALERLVAGPCPNLPAVKAEVQKALQNGKLTQKKVDAFYRGERPLSELGIVIPPLVQDYLGLGRFRDALVMDEFQRRPSLALAQFIKENHIAPAGMEIKGRDVLQLSPDVSLRNSGHTSSTELRY